MFGCTPFRWFSPSFWLFCPFLPGRNVSDTVLNRSAGCNRDAKPHRTSRSAACRVLFGRRFTREGDSFGLLSVLFLSAGCSDGIAAPSSEEVLTTANAITALFMALPAVAVGQSTLGFRGGLSLASLGGDDAENFDTRTGVSFGGFFNVPVSDVLGGRRVRAEGCHRDRVGR